MPGNRPYSQVTVQFRSGENQLAGLLTLPTGPGPHPAVVFVHGSGSTTRDSSGFYSPIFEQFASRGIASLSWDKPGVGDSTGHFLQQSFDDRASEAIAGIGFLRLREDIDLESIGLWGISQAGWVMPLVCERVAEIAFAIAVSVPVTTAAEQDLYRISHTMSADGYKEEDVEKALGLTRRVHEFVRQDSFEDAVAELRKHEGERWIEVAAGRPDPANFEFAKKILFIDPKPHIRAMKCPVLLIFGEKDTLVDIEESTETYQRLLAEAGNADLTVRAFPDANHSVILANTGGQEEMRRLRESGKWQFAPGYLELMGDWLARWVGRG